MNKFPMRALIVLFIFSIATMANAQATRTWVSGVGDDANPCSRTAPCKTYAGAISKTAPKGEISTLDPGGFGAVTITKPIYIDGAEQIAGILAASTNGIIINAASGDFVYLRNLDINGAGSGFDGIRILSAKAVVIDNCRIHSFTGDGIEIAPGANNVKVTVINSEIHNNTGDGIKILPTGVGVVNLVVDNSEVSYNATNGVDVAGANNIAAVYNSELSGNGSALVVQQTTSKLVAEGCALHFNTTAITAGVGVNTPALKLSRCMITNNGTGIAGSGQVQGFQSNVVIDNGGVNTLNPSTAPQ